MEYIDRSFHSSQSRIIMHSRSLTLLLFGVLAVGCTTAQTSNTARTSTEQLLISNAVDRALDKVDFQAFSGRAVYLEEKYIDCVDKNYVIASLRHRLLASGATLVAADAAEVIVEARSGGVGTASSESFVGTPEIALPGMLTIPEVRLITRTKQEGAAKIGLVAYDAATKRVLGPGGQSLAQSDNNLWYAAGVGPWRSGSLKQDVLRSTTGRAAWSRETLPHYVAFNPMPPAAEPSRIQITGAEEPGKLPPAEAPGELPADTGSAKVQVTQP
jgi:hypothetical protein